MQTARWGLGQLAQSKATDSSAATLDPAALSAPVEWATSTDAKVAPEAELTFADSSTETDSPTVGVILNEYA